MKNYWENKQQSQLTARLTTETYPFIQQVFAAPFPFITIFSAKSPHKTGFRSDPCRVRMHHTKQNKIRPKIAQHFIIKRQTIG
jgi:hypothetical protein